MRGHAVVLAIVVGLASRSAMAAPPSTGQGQAMTLTLTSSAFRQGQPIPSFYTCDGQNVSPPIAWTGVPAGMKSLALVVEDPDAPSGTWTHWVVYSIPPTMTSLQGGFTTDPHTQHGIQQGTTDFGRTGYGGPCPPSGSHRYVFKLYALDADLLLDDGATAADLTHAMQGHILAQAQLMGTYRRQKR